MTNVASPPPAGTAAQPDREHSARWWNSMWAGSRSRYVEDLDDVRGQWELYEIRKYEYLRSLFPATPGTLALECGCGSAGVSLHFACRGYRTVMLDFAPSALGLARHNFAATGATGVFVNGDVNGMPFADRQFDVVCSFGLIEHFVDVRPIIREMVRVLRPGGLLFLDIVPARFNVQTIANIVFNCWAALGYGVVSGNPRLGVEKAAALFRPPYFENAFSREQYAGWMEEAGCEGVFITGNNPFPRLYLPAAVDRVFLRWLIGCLPAWRRFDAMRDGTWKRHWARAWWAHGYKRALDGLNQSAGGGHGRMTGVPQGAPEARPTLTPLVCSKCREGGLVDEGPVLRCRGCGSRYAVRNGVVDMLELIPVTERERAGNRLIVQEERARADRAWLLGLPGSFGETADYRSNMADHDFVADLELAADRLKLLGGSVVVELGAGCCWTSWRLAKRGWRVAATDISEEEYVGLRSGAIFMEEHGVRFDRILSDMSGRWPYADGSVDGVIANCSIHHAHNLSSVFAEAYRVLRPGRRFAFVEATTGVVWRTDRDFGQYEKQRFGWNEHLYPIGIYQRIAKRAGFRLRYEPAPSTQAKLAAVLEGRLGNVRGLKFALTRLAAPVLRSSVTRDWLLGPLYPLVNRVIGTQIVGVAEKAG